MVGTQSPRPRGSGKRPRERVVCVRRGSRGERGSGKRPRERVRKVKPLAPLLLAARLPHTLPYSLRIRCLYSAVNRRRVARGFTSVGGTVSPWLPAFIFFFIVDSRLALYSKLKGAGCLTHVGTEGLLHVCSTERA